MALILQHCAFGTPSCLAAPAREGSTRKARHAVVYCGTASSQQECEQQYIVGAMDSAHPTGYHNLCKWAAGATCVSSGPVVCHSLSTWHGCPRLNAIWAAMRGFSYESAKRWGCHKDGGWISSSGIYHSLVRSAAFGVDEKVGQVGLAVEDQRAVLGDTMFAETSRWADRVIAQDDREALLKAANAHD